MQYQTEQKSDRNTTPHALIVWLICILLFPLLSNAYAQAPLVITTGEYAPYTGKSLPQGGMITEILTTALERAEIPYVLKWTPWTRSMEDLRTGDIDGTFPWTPNTDNRPEFSVATHQLFSIKMQFYCNANRELDISSLEDLKGLTFCRPDGYSLVSEELKEMVKNNTIEHFSPKDMATCFNMLDKMRVDIVLPDSELEALSAMHAATGRTDSALRTPTSWKWYQ